jgi:tetratricopeptide (TPR) repeat protein
MADRYMYMPLVGLTILVAWGLRDAVAGWQRGTTVLGYVAVAALAVLASVSQAQLTHWRNGETLFAHAVAVTRDNAIALYNLGTLELRRGDNAGAEKHLVEAVRANPAYADAQANLGALYLAKGDLANAASHFTQALRHAPRDAMTLTNLAYVHMQQGKLSRAGELLQQALARDPTYSNAIALNNQLRAMYAAPTAGTARR